MVVLVLNSWIIMGLEIAKYVKPDGWNDRHATMTKSLMMVWDQKVKFKWMTFHEHLLTSTIQYFDHRCYPLINQTCEKVVKI
jgi:hypothetical protein